MKLLKYSALLSLCASLLIMGIEKENPCVDGDEIVSMIEQFEGWRDKPYQDMIGIGTVGYGFTKPFLKLWDLQFSDIDRETGKAAVLQYCYIVNAKYFDKTHLTKLQRKATFSFLYHVGETAYNKSTLNKLAIERSLTNGEVCHELKKYVFANKQFIQGFENRRLLECEIMEK